MLFAQSPRLKCVTVTDSVSGHYLLKNFANAEAFKFPSYDHRSRDGLLVVLFLHWLLPHQLPDHRERGTCSDSEKPSVALMEWLETVAFVFPRSRRNSWILEAGLPLNKDIVSSQLWLRTSFKRVTNISGQELSSRKDNL
jgi:hypothetical protein